MLCQDPILEIIGILRRDVLVKDRVDLIEQQEGVTELVLDLHEIHAGRVENGPRQRFCLVAYGVANVAALESSGLGIVLPIIGRKVA